MTLSPVAQINQSRANSLAALENISKEPPYCECARIGSRALADGSMPVLRYLTGSIGYLDRINLQLEHQHVMFDQSRDNIGLMGSEGQPELFREDVDNQTYHFASDECLDGSLMRRAVMTTGIPQAYAWLGYNCQAYIDSVREKYGELKANVFGGICRADGQGEIVSSPPY